MLRKLQNNKRSYIFILLFFISLPLISSDQIDICDIKKNFNYFKLVDREGIACQASTFFDHDTIAIFVFSPSCLFCDRNAIYWKKLKDKYPNHFIAIGIVLSDTNTFERFCDKCIFPFKVYRAISIQKFKSIVKIDENFSKTLIIKGDKVVFEKNGNLTFDEFLEIKSIIIGGNQ